MGLGTSKLEKAIVTEFPDGQNFYGFENYGNTCYCNSVLQALYFCTAFREQLLSKAIDVKGTSELEETLFSCLGELFYNIDSQKKRSGVIGPRKFVAKLRKENELFRGFMHQDAHEFLNYLLNEVAEYIQKCNKKKQEGKSENTSQEALKVFIHHIFLKEH